jgi:hypothetical protein
VNLLSLQLKSALARRFFRPTRILCKYGFPARRSRKGFVISKKNAGHSERSEA